MKIIISPSKTQKIKKIKDFEEKDLIYKEETDKLIKILKKFKKEEIQKIMKTSDKLTDEIYKNYKNFYKNELGHAAASYTGIAYKALDIESFSKKDIEYLEEHMIILSALYGVLTPLTKIYPYRLDMNMSILEKKSLYEYWNKNVNEYFENEDTIINLASKEFSKMLKKPLVDIDFFEKKNGKLVQISTNSKKARGEMASVIIKNRVESIEKLKKVVFDNYRFDKKLSQENRLVFVK